jgi:two-component system alkaline phosphatase synthesis response regulator PhoP
VRRRQLEGWARVPGPEPETNRGGALGSENYCILVVDDTPFLRELAAVFLVRSGRVLTASNGHEALLVARRERPDLILSDLHMPGVSGADLCRAIKRDPELEHTPFVMLIAGESAHDRALSVRAGADDLLNKPLERTDLTETVARFLRFSHVRGLPRVEMKAPVTMYTPANQSRGVVRNLSRGGIFVESPRPLPAQAEVSLCFQLPDSPFEYTPTARVLWHREAQESAQGVGMGMRFLEIDGTTVRLLEDYVYERVRSWSELDHGAVS